MRLVKNWKQVAGQSWSSRCHLIAAGLYAVVAGCLMFWPALQYSMPLVWFCTGAVALNLAGFGLRLIDQGLSDPGAGRF